MRIHRTRHDRDFTVVPNALARNRKLSFTARGVAVHLISLLDGAQETVRTLADRNPGVGRKGVANALDELVAAGYYFRFTIRDTDTGQVWTETAIHDTPQMEDSPVPASPAPGDPAPGNAGTLPTGVKDPVSKDLGKTPSLPSVDQVQTPAPPAREGSNKASQDHALEAARILSRLEAVDFRLRLSRRQTQALAPLAAQWLQNGASVAEITDAVVQGLPAKVYAPAKLVADRLVRKLPAPRRAWAQYADCSDGCGRVLPAGQDSGICGVCAGVVPAPAVRELTADRTPDPAVAPAADGIRAALKARRSAA
ncbi:hypothetical protein [Streptomyces sp. NPDC056524]|uniref:hypothetical protein n=1 Tax=Streptomyces sp. NPDC056524 TaxID=3345851 RepID=UPI00367CC588